VHDGSRHAGITRDLAFGGIFVFMSAGCSFRFFYCNRVTVL
jgi:hypothetical protein